VKQSPVAGAVTERYAETWGVGPDWAPEAYGRYYATSALVYAAVKIRAEAIVRAPLLVYRKKQDGSVEEVASIHPLAELLRRANDFWTRGDLWRATSTYLDLWGSCYWVLTKNRPGATPREIWPVRPDKMRIVTDKTQYIKGFIYQQHGVSVPLLPDEVVWFRHFNPLNELAGLSPMAPLRLSIDTATDALKSNRQLFKNGLLMSNVALKADATMSDAEVQEFEKRLEKRFAHPENAHRPMVIAGVEPKNLGFSPKDMEYLNMLRWSLEDVARVYGVPKPMLSDLERATYANIDAAERMFWRNTIVPYLLFLQEEVTEMLAPQFGSDLFVKFDLTEIEALQENVNQVWERLRENVKTGLVTVNEAREEMALTPVAWGDSWWAPMTLLPVSSGASSTPGLGSAMLPAPNVSDFEPNGWKRWKSPAMSDLLLDRASGIYLKRLDAHERRFIDMQKGLFGKQLRDVLKRLRKATKAVKQVEGELFGGAEWLSAFQAEGGVLFLSALVDGAEAEAALWGLGAFNPRAAGIQEWLDARVDFWANRVNEETGRLLAQELAEASELGEGIKEIQGRVEKVFRFNDEIRSERIARTEMHAATNHGAIEEYRQSGVVAQKMWLTTIDGRERDAHREAHRQMVPLDGKFEVGGEFLDGPGDGSPGTSINCRCNTAPVVGKPAKVLPGRRDIGSTI